MAYNCCTPGRSELYYQQLRARIAAREKALEAKKAAREAKKARQVAERVAVGPPATIMSNIEEARAVMLGLLIAHPQLSDFGFGVFDEYKLNKAEYAKQLKAQRARMLEPVSLARFMRAARWLTSFPKTKTINKRGTSYGLKHHCARYLGGPEGGYTTNGVFIAAAIASGFKVERCWWNSPNAYLGISSLAWSAPELGAAEAETTANAQGPKDEPVTVRELVPAE
jgi:hypothetical protein